MMNNKRPLEIDAQLQSQSQSQSQQQRTDPLPTNKKQKGTSNSPIGKSTGLLDENEKKARHIASEKKRREAIRNAFDKLVELVPSLTPAESRTEVAVLTKSASFIDLLNYENRKLVELLQKNNIELPDHLLNEYSIE